MVGILVSFWDGLFSGPMLVSGRVWHHFCRSTGSKNSDSCGSPWNGPFGVIEVENGTSWTWRLSCGWEGCNSTQYDIFNVSMIGAILVLGRVLNMFLWMIDMSFIFRFKVVRGCSTQSSLLVQMAWIPAVYIRQSSKSHLAVFFNG